MDEDCQRRCGALSARIDGLARLIDERRDRAEERFVSIQKATDIATQTAQNATDRLAAIYAAQHKQVVDQITINTGRITALEQNIVTKRETLSSSHQIATIVGVLFSVAVSAVTVLFNVFIYLKK